MTTLPSEPFAELANKRFEEWWARDVEQFPHHAGLRIGIEKERARRSWQAAQPTSEQMSEAARKIADECDRGSPEFVYEKALQILNETLGGQ